MLYIHKYTSVQFWLYISKNQVVIPIYSKLREYLRDFMIPNHPNSFLHPLDLYNNLIKNQFVTKNRSCYPLYGFISLNLDLQLQTRILQVCNFVFTNIKTKI